MKQSRNRLSSPTVWPTLTAAGLGLFLLWRWQRRQRQPTELAGQVVLITGASRGLGLLLAHEFAHAHCRLIICARDEQELAWAQRELEQAGAEVFALPCNVADEVQVNHLVTQAIGHYGRIDILVNNAGIIDVGPLQSTQLADFEQALDVMYWGMLYTIWAVLPQMRARGDGRIVNITSIGGKVSIPHLLPYSSAKFAAVGLSEGLRAELTREGIAVTTIVPGLMRTGSHLNASFKGDLAGEFTWFSLGASLPLISMDAQRAAEQIVMATCRREAVRILSLPALVLAYIHDLFPGFTNDTLGLINRLLPDGKGDLSQRRRGLEVQAALPPTHQRLQKLLTTWGRQAAERLHQYPLADDTTATLEWRATGNRQNVGSD
ncbi:MAG: SDR family NAD(P)-dependent oxidoreductase [Caldilineaceae bacterium]